MRNKEKHILAINPGSRYLALAVFLHTELRDWTIKVVKGRNIIDLISKYARRYHVNVFAMKNFHPSRTSKRVKEIISALQVFAKAHNGCLYQYSIDEVKDRILINRDKNKKSLMEEIGIRYPFLLEAIQKEMRKKNPYLIRMFEAIAVGVSCLQDIDAGEEKVVKKE